MSKMRRESVLEGEPTTPSQESLENCLRRTSRLLSHPLDETEVQAWKELVSCYSSQAIEWAFKEWEKKAKLFFPKPKEIVDLCDDFKRANRVEFHSCSECDDGWVRVYEGKTAGGKDVDSKFGAVTRCQCWLQWRGRAA